MTPAQQHTGIARLSDSPWFWAMLFGAAGAAVLLAAGPQYAKRQRRLEMQFYARQEIERRQVEGSPKARAPGEEGSAAPPMPGELLIALWPMVGLSLGLFALSAIMLWRSRRAPPGSPADSPQSPAT